MMDTEIREEPAATSPLFKLPEELRLAIYGYVLTVGFPIQWPDDHNDAHLTPALLRTCRTIHKEATAVLYSTNTLAFQHPSDCNMFGWAHSPDSARQITSIALHIRDKDVRSLWTGYLGSADVHRSLTFDYPALSTLNITFRSNYWLQMHGQPADKFQQWMSDPHLKDLRLSLLEKAPENLKVRLMAVHRAPPAEIRALVQSEELRDKLDVDSETLGVRTEYTRVYNVEVALALTPTGHI
ncbi:hypothetical protein NA57DRAFT_51205 [Rhizodiscina lignyota]|uniref:F-box domain-containing protein n=1 Tax=Rhizodiscina lignyota TaxID=1504668 RepID=A0A9P4IMQ5_9PEZI|nr:hypothetical protein NA57DRAFT_51205 [Rhizodiscina lignyota]